MARRDVEEKIIKPMLALYLPPRPNMSEAERTMALNGYIASLKQFDSGILEEAWNRVVAQQRSRIWPTPGVITEEAYKVAKSRRAEAQKEPIRDIEEERQAYWRSVLTSPKVKMAAQLGIAWSLKCAIIGDGKSLQEINLKQLAAAHASAETLAMRLQAGQPSGLWNGRKLGVMSPGLRDQALAMYRNLQIAEAQTLDEIAKHTGFRP